MTSFTTTPLSLTRALGLGLSIAALTSPADASASPTQVEVCHVLGNGNVNSIFVNPNAVPALLASGDFLPQTWFIDADGDGYGDAGQSVEACEPPPGYVDNADDCDDTDPSLTLDCSSVNFGNCLAASELTTCDVDLSSGAISCDNGTPMSLYAGANGEFTFRLDMDAWSAVSVSMDLDNPTGYWFNLGNSRTNNGWSGDSSTNSNDSEAQGYNTGMYLYASDFGGSAGLMSTPAFAAGQDVGTAIACDGYYAYESSLGFNEVYDANIMQIDGDEPDPQAGGINDTLLWLGVNRVVAGGRTGSGVVGLTVTFGR